MGVDNECLLCSSTYSYENNMAGFVEYQCSVGEGVQVYVRKVLLHWLQMSIKEKNRYALRRCG